MKNAIRTIKNKLNKLNTLFSATLLAMVGTVNIASLPAAAVTASFGSVAVALAAQAAPWLGLGAALVASGEAIAATNKGVAGVGIKVCKRPGGCRSSARTAQVPVRSGVDGSFQFIGLEPGDYDVTPDGGKTMVFTVGADGKLGGVVQEEGGVRSVAKLRPGGMGPVGSVSPASAVSDNNQVNTQGKASSNPNTATPTSSVPSGTERGIKDNGVKGCTGCGISG